MNDNTNCLNNDSYTRNEALNTSLSFIVQAPAGSGKTELLTQRFLALLTVSKLPEEILSITFTNKAAIEMKNRIIEALLAADQNIEPTEEHKKITFKLAQKALQQNNQHNWEIIQNPNRLNIMTIDAFAAKLIKLMPILSSTNSELNISTEPYFIYKQAARKTINMLEHSDETIKNNLSQLLKHVNNQVHFLEKLLADMLSKREQWLPNIVPMQNTNIKNTLERALQNIIFDCLENIINIFPVDILKQITNIAYFSIQNTQNSKLAPEDFSNTPEAITGDLDKWKFICNILLTSSFSWRKTLTIKQGFPSPSSAKTKEDKEMFKEMKYRALSIIDILKEHPELNRSLNELALLPKPKYDQKQWATLQSLVEILPLLAAQLNVTFQETNKIDFNEINIQALNSLMDDHFPSELALYLDHQIKHLLIDEFQDTSMIQYKLFEAILSEWEPNDGRTIFAVGDPMQSIYRFREADVSLFLRTAKHGINNVKIKKLLLNLNFRSQEHIINWVNNTFSNIFPKKNHIGSGAIKYTPSSPAKNNEPNSIVKNIYCFSEQEESDLVYSTIYQEQQASPTKKIAILARTRSHLKNILYSLSKK